MWLCICTRVILVLQKVHEFDLQRAKHHVQAFLLNNPIKLNFHKVNTSMRERLIHTKIEEICYYHGLTRWDVLPEGQSKFNKRTKWKPALLEHFAGDPSTQPIDADNSCEASTRYWCMMTGRDKFDDDDFDAEYTHKPKVTNESLSRQSLSHRTNKRHKGRSQWDGYGTYRRSKQEQKSNQPPVDYLPDCWQQCVRRLSYWHVRDHYVRSQEDEVKCPHLLPFEDVADSTDGKSGRFAHLYNDLVIKPHDPDHFVPDVDVAPRRARGGDDSNEQDFDANIGASLDAINPSRICFIANSHLHLGDDVEIGPNYDPFAGLL